MASSIAFSSWCFVRFLSFTFERIIYFPLCMWDRLLLCGAVCAGNHVFLRKVCAPPFWLLDLLWVLVRGSLWAWVLYVLDFTSFFMLLEYLIIHLRKVVWEITHGFSESASILLSHLISCVWDYGFTVVSSQFCRRWPLFCRYLVRLVKRLLLIFCLGVFTPFWKSFWTFSTNSPLEICIFSF